MNDNLTGGFESIGEFCIAVRKFYAGVNDSKIQTLREKATLVEGTDSLGGVLVPSQFAQEIRHAALESSIVRPRAVVSPMGRDTLDIPVLVDSSRATALWGGVTMTWVAEGGDLATGATDGKLGSLKLSAHNGVLSAFAGNELVADAPAFGTYMTTAFGKALAFYEDAAFVNGTGSGQPLGVKNAGCTISIGRESNVHITARDLALMSERLLPGSWPTAVWLINQTVLADWIRYGAETGILDVADLSGMTILGRPVIVTEKCAALGTATDIILADFQHYAIGDRALIMASSRETTYSSASYGWLQNQTCYTLTTRVDGQPILPAAITAYKGGKTLSPFVTLSAQVS